MLITNEQQLKQCLPVNTNTSLFTLEGAIRQAEEKYLVPAIGRQTLDTLAALVDDPPGDARREIIYQLQCAEVRLGWFDSFDLLAVQLSETGLQDANGEHRAYRYQADAARRTLERQGHDHLNQAMLLLDQNTGLVPSYIDAPHYSGNTRSLFTTSEAFFAAADTLGRDALLFHSLRPFVDDAENYWLPHYVPQAVIGDCIHYLGGNAEPSQHYSEARAAAVVRSMQKTVAMHSLENAAPLLGARFTAHGMQTANPDHGDQTTDRTAEPQAVDQWSHFYKRLADLSLSNTLYIMKSHPELYPDFEAYGKEKAPDATPFRRNNQGRKAVFL